MTSNNWIAWSVVDSSLTTFARGLHADPVETVGTTVGFLDVGEAENGIPLGALEGLSVGLVVGLLVG